MLKRQKFPSSQRPEGDSFSEDNFYIETPANDSRIRLLRCNFGHDNQFFFKIAASKYYASSPKNEHNKSLQLNQEIYRPDLSPQILKANQTLAHDKQNINRNNRLETSSSIKNTASSLSPSRRRGCILNPATLPTPPIQVTPTNKQTLRDIVRRKSCHCHDCGGLSALEKKTVHLPPEPRKLKIKNLSPKVLTPRTGTKSPQYAKSPGPNKSKFRRGSVAASMFSKKSETDDFPLPQLLNLQTRSRGKTYGGPESVMTPEKDGTDSSSSEETFRKQAVENKLERSMFRKISGKKAEKSLDKSSFKEKLSRSVSIKEVYTAKIVNAPSVKLKKGRFKRYASVRCEVVSGNQSARIYDSEVITCSSITNENKNMKKNFMSEKRSSETARNSVSTIMSKEIPNLKNLLTNTIKSKPQGLVAMEKITRVPPIAISLSKIKLKQNIANFYENRPASLPRLIMNKKAQNTSQDFDTKRMPEWEEESVSRDNAKKYRMKGQPLLGSQMHRGEVQSSRNIRTNLTKGDSRNESFGKNLKLVVESDKIVEKNRKKKKKLAKGSEVVWKKYMQTAFLAYKKTSSTDKLKTNFQSHTYRSTQE